MSLTPQSVREFRKGEREVGDAEAEEAQHRWSRHPHSTRMYPGSAAELEEVWESETKAALKAGEERKQ